MLTPAEQQALQASQLSFQGDNVMPTQMVPSQPVNGEILPQIQTSTPLAAAVHSGDTTQVEGEEAAAKRLKAASSGQAAVDATTAAAQGTTEAPPAPVVAPVPMAPPTGAGLSGEIPTGQTLPEQKDINAAALAATQKQLADDKIKWDAAINAEAARRTDDWNKEYAALKAKATSASNITTLKEDSSFMANFARAVAAGLGAYASIKGGGPNSAQHILDQEMSQDFERKKLRMSNAVEQMEKFGATRQMIDKFRDTEAAKLLADQSARLAQVNAATGVMLGRFPQAQMDAKAMIANKQAEVDAKAAEAAKDVGKRVHESGSATPATIQQSTMPGTAQLKAGESKTAGQAVIAKAALKSAKENQKYLNGLDEEEYAQVTQAYKRGQAAAEHNDEGFKGGVLRRAGAALSEGAYEATGGLVGTPASGFQAARLAGGEGAEGFISRDEKVTGAVVGLTNPRAAANPEALAKLAEKRGSAVEGISLEEARRRNAEHIKVLESETDRQALPLAKIEATAAQREGRAPSPPAPVTGQQLTKLSPKERQDYVDAKRTKSDSPDYAGAQAAIRKLEKKAREGQK
jgi:hypothetical protein